MLLLCRYTPLIDNIYWLIYFFFSNIFLILVNIYCCDLIYSNYDIISLFIYFDAITCYIYDSLYVVYIISNEWDKGIVFFLYIFVFMYLLLL